MGMKSFELYGSLGAKLGGNRAAVGAIWKEIHFAVGENSVNVEEEESDLAGAGLSGKCFGHSTDCIEFREASESVGGLAVFRKLLYVEMRSGKLVGPGIEKMELGWPTIWTHVC